VHCILSCLYRLWTDKRNWWTKQF